MGSSSFCTLEGFNIPQYKEARVVIAEEVGAICLTLITLSEALCISLLTWLMEYIRSTLENSLSDEDSMVIERSRSRSSLQP